MCVAIRCPQSPEEQGWGVSKVFLHMHALILQLAELYGKQTEKTMMSFAACTLPSLYLNIQLSIPAPVPRLLTSVSGENV